ncbi:MAG TPA: acyl-CoA dehydrogenase family protein [Tepidiformaceae bacterium]|nr:acyl-CoA dehydrogenase family protein [Tepidiformaceae bacterium]HNO64899.1 acyl-CoA dehydrogenase family protein [Tepidiformaceae bacterium]
MRYTYEPDVEAFRQEVRQFIKDNLPPEEERLKRGYEGGFKTNQEEYDYTMGFQKKLAARDWLAMAWPKEYGGGGASHMRQLVYNEEMAYHGAPSGNMGIAWVGPSLMLYGTEEQKAKFIPHITNADDWWCTLYSEPGAGSDLAALQTRAVRDGDEFVINGQKIWTSGGHLADWGWLAARTDPDAPKHKGITMFMVDMKSPGITVRPLINMSDRHGFNEVFFEDVRIPANQLVGELNRGWYHMAVALDFERSGIAAFAGGRRSVERLGEIARRNPELIERRPSVRYELADRAVEVTVGTILAYRVATMQAKGLVPNYEASTSKLFGSEMGQRISLTGMHLLGTLGQLRDGTKHQVFDQATGYLGSVSGTIAAGTSEIQRGIIATRGLGLPRG